MCLFLAVLDLHWCVGFLSCDGAGEGGTSSQVNSLSPADGGFLQQWLMMVAFQGTP